MSAQELEQLYHLYCSYTGRLNAAVDCQGMRIPDLKAVTYPEFQAIWSSISELQQEFWRQRFEAGYEDVAEAQRRRLVAAFASNTSRHEISSVRAA